MTLLSLISRRSRNLGKFRFKYSFKPKYWNRFNKLRVFNRYFTTGYRYKSLNHFVLTNSVNPLFSSNKFSTSNPDFETTYKATDTETIKKQIEKDVTENGVFLYMKGTPQQPMCGFSKQVIMMLDNFNTQYKTRDVLSHPSLRPALKEYSNWPTFPQLYINGELIGGFDICFELFKNGELEEMLNDVNKQNEENNSNK